MGDAIAPLPNEDGSSQRSAMPAVVVLAALMAATLMAAPGVVGALIGSWGYSPSHAGYAIGIEQFLMSIAAIPAIWWTQRSDRTGIVRWCLAATAATNLLCVVYHGFGILLVLRAVTGLAGGSVMAACLSVVGASGKPERNFAFWAVGQLALGAGALALLQAISPGQRASSFFAGLAAVIAAAVPLAGWLGPPSSRVGGSHPARFVMSLGATTGLLAVLTFYLAIGGVWTYLGRIGGQNNLPPALIAHALAVASLFGIGGCCFAALLGARVGRAMPMSVGYLVLVAAISALWFPSTETRFRVVTIAFLFSWTLSLPYLLATVAAHDRSGRLSVLTNLMIGTGLGFGPALFALAVPASSDFRSGLPYAAGTMAVSLVMALLTSKLATAPAGSR
jgi:predicted MFS family arabinose efflux permease